MTQRIFDIENEKDMQDLQDILPDNVAKIIRNEPEKYYLIKYVDSQNVDFLPYAKINWHNKTEITRPVDYESMIGCVGWFWDNEIDKKHKRLGVLTGMEEGYFCDERVSRWGHFSPAKKSELKFWEDVE